MFTKKVTDDDNFMSLSSSAQALYLHLSMSADDDGFCNQVSVCMFKAHASVQDLESLLSKRYIYQFDNGVIVIKHWRMANALRKDRYTPTAFQEELAKLQLKDNGSYTWLPSGCRPVAACLPQDRLDKDSIGKDSIGYSASTKDKARLERGADEEEAVVDEDLSRVMTFYSEYVSKAIPSSLQTQSIIDFVNELGADVVIHAMEITAESDTRGWRYLKKILERYRDNGLTSIEAVIEDEGRYLQKIDTGVRKNGNSGMDKGRSRKKWDIHTDAG